MCHNKDWFNSHDESHGGQVLLGNNKAYKVIGIRLVKLKHADGKIRALQEVRHVPNLKRNITSLEMVDKQGYVCKAEGGLLKVTKGSMELMKGKLEDGLYCISFNKAF